MSSALQRLPRVAVFTRALLSEIPYQGPVPLAVTEALQAYNAVIAHPATSAAELDAARHRLQYLYHIYITPTVYVPKIQGGGRERLQLAHRAWKVVAKASQAYSPTQEQLLHHHNEPTTHKRCWVGGGETRPSESPQMKTPFSREHAGTSTKAATWELLIRRLPRKTISGLGTGRGCRHFRGFLVPINVFVFPDTESVQKPSKPFRSMVQ